MYRILGLDRKFICHKYESSKQMLTILRLNSSRFGHGKHYVELLDEVDSKLCARRRKFISSLSATYRYDIGIKCDAQTGENL